MTEIWKDIKGYKNAYKISSFGNVKSLDKTILSKNNVEMSFYGKLLKQNTNRGGYLRLNLTHNNKRKRVLVHQLVATHFINNKLNKKTVNHKNGVKTDNRVENLEWLSFSDNISHAHKNGLMNYDCHTLKLNKKQVLEIIKKYRNKIITTYKLAIEYKVSQRTIMNVLHSKFGYSK